MIKKWFLIVNRGNGYSISDKMFDTEVEAKNEAERLFKIGEEETVPDVDYITITKDIVEEYLRKNPVKKLRLIEVCSWDNDVSYPLGMDRYFDSEEEAYGALYDENEEEFSAIVNSDPMKIYEDSKKLTNREKFIEDPNGIFDESGHWFDVELYEVKGL